MGPVNASLLADGTEEYKSGLRVPLKPTGTCVTSTALRNNYETARQVYALHTKDDMMPRSACGGPRDTVLLIPDERAN